MASIVVPTLGESVSEATVAKWLKREGEAVKADEPLVELETDKVTLEVNAPSAGVLMKISAPQGTAVKVGAMLGEITAGGTATVQAAAPANDKPAVAPAPVAAAPAPVSVMPAARKMADDNKIDTSNIAGTGKDNRVTKGDVISALQAPSAPAPVATPSLPRELGSREERVKMTRLRQRIAQRLKEAQNTAAMLTTFNEIDMGAVIDMRNAYKDQFEKKHGVKLGFMSFFVKAAVQALREFPAVNAEINGDDIIYKNYYDISVAVSTPQGLVVPVVRDCDVKSMAQIEKDIGDLGARAKDGKLGMNDMTGGTFTITNGSLMSTPIINPPQVGILGMHKTMPRAMVMKDGSIAARPMMYVALSYDHRIIDGREAVGFLVRIKEALEDPQRLILDV
jgi:2-oxoglutarate dehydrogenase E2 component (dihydrolipoamide succinyltransferase)